MSGAWAATFGAIHAANVREEKAAKYRRENPLPSCSIETVIVFRNEGLLC